ncbi:MAG: phenylalanine--tRNA ligase subunit alpha [Hyphomicrobiales bacterium]|nr:phenylalanine--tRNA ligase subunit alpha [Hyphomicrobiales bacterium]
MHAEAASDTDLPALQAALIAAVERASNLAELDEARIASLGKKGRIPELMQRLGGMAPDERKRFGAAVNGVKEAVTAALEARRDALAKAANEQRLLAERADITLPARAGAEQLGRIHPLTRVWEDMTRILMGMGFAVADGPDIETDDNNFTKLNFPVGHPARETHDTFFFNPKADGTRLLLRTHTSTVQVRTMLAQKPPIRIISPGRVYRCDSDQTHTPMFHQIEALVIDEDTHMGHLKWTLAEMCKAFFEVDDVRMRFRASHFPFTEPSMEVDIGAEAIGKPGKWLEIGGAGMVHPNVLANCGIDPERYQGFAFGMGLDRMTMLKYGIPDLRPFFGGDLRWLRHYGFTLAEL